MKPHRHKPNVALNRGFSQGCKPSPTSGGDLDLHGVVREVVAATYTQIALSPPKVLAGQVRELGGIPSVRGCEYLRVIALKLDESPWHRLAPCKVREESVTLLSNS